MCYPDGKFQTSPADILLGELAGARAGPAGPVLDVGLAVPVLEAHTHLTVDVVPGRGGGFSVEAPEGSAS
jgi:uncharacterized protein (DUF779 family)